MIRENADELFGEGIPEEKVRRYPMPDLFLGRVAQRIQQTMNKLGYEPSYGEKPFVIAETPIGGTIRMIQVFIWGHKVA